MRTDRRYTRNFSGFAALLSVVFFICLITTPSIETFTNRYVRSGDKSTSASKAQLPQKQSGEKHFFTEIIQNEVFSELSFSLFIEKGLQSVQVIYLRALHVILPFVGLVSLIYCLRYFMRKRSRHRSVLAISIGGHAPPQSITIG